MDRAVSERPSPWVIGIIVGLGIVIAFNMVYAYVAISDADPIAPSYNVESR